jgi:hypothetical protein
MAKFKMELPNDLIKEFSNLERNTEKILGEMTKAGAEVVYNNIQSNAPSGLKKSKIMGCLKITKTYKTRSDDGINTKVGFYGYFENENGVETPAPLVVNVFEYGRSGKSFPKKPFIRRSFNKAQIEKAMLRVQEKYLPKE